VDSVIHRLLSGNIFMDRTRYDMSEEWKEYIFSGKFKISIPSNLMEVQAQGIDSDFREWKGKGIIVRVDVSLFSDTLTSYEKQNHYTSFNEEFAGQAAKIVSFDKEDDTHFVGAHFANLDSPSDDRRQKFTVVVESSQSMGIEIPLRIIRSIKFVD
jgi:hypothetical protein